MAPAPRHGGLIGLKGSFGGSPTPHRHGPRTRCTSRPRRSDLQIAKGFAIGFAIGRSLLRGSGFFAIGAAVARIALMELKQTATRPRANPDISGYLNGSGWPAENLCATMLSRRVQRIDALRGNSAERGHPGGAAKCRAEVFRRPAAGERRSSRSGDRSYGGSMAYLANDRRWIWTSLP